MLSTGIGLIITFATVRPNQALALLFVYWRKPSRPGNRSSSWRFLRWRRLPKEEGKRPLRRRPRPEENGSAGLPSLQIASLEVKGFFGGKIAVVLLHLFFSQISHTRLLLRPKYRGPASEAHFGVFAWRALSRKKMIGFFASWKSHPITWLPATANPCGGGQPKTIVGYIGGGGAPPGAGKKGCCCCCCCCCSWKLTCCCCCIDIGAINPWGIIGIGIIMGTPPGPGRQLSKV